MANLMADVKALIQRIHRDCHFIATVEDTSGNTIQIRRSGASTPDGSYYQAADGVAAAVSPGDKVLVVDVTAAGGYLVVCKVP